MMNSLNRTLLTAISTFCALLSSGILLQTLYFKFTGHPESVMIFTQLGVEPWGRILAGIVELVLGIAIIVPRTRFLASIGVCLLMIGAIASHIFILGTGGMQTSLFILACIAFITADISGAIVYYLRHRTV